MDMILTTDIDTGEFGAKDVEQDLNRLLRNDGQVSARRE